METLSTVTVQGDVRVSEYIVDELVHRGLLELAPLVRLAAELGGPADLLLEEVGYVCVRVRACG